MIKLFKSKRRINGLTKEQEEYLPVFRQNILNEALDGKRIKRDKLEQALEDAYGLIGKEKPLLIILQSPFQAMMAISFLKKFASGDLGGDLNSQLRSQLESKMNHQLSSQLRSQLESQLGSQLGSQLWSQLGSQLRSQLESQLRSQLESQLRNQLSNVLNSQLESKMNHQLSSQLAYLLRGKLQVQMMNHQPANQLNGQNTELRSQLARQLRHQLRRQLWEQLTRQLWIQLERQLEDQLGSRLDYQLRDQQDIQFHSTKLWGSQDLYWIAFYKFCNEIGVNYTDEQKRILDINYRIGQQCEWWWPYDGICFVSEKPIETKWDDNKLLHSETGAAVLYEDGYSLYSWHGTSIPKEWIEDKESLTAEHALTWENIEQRRCAAEIIGWDKILQDPRLNARTIEKDGDPEIGELIEVDIPEIGTERFLKVQCGTGRTFALPVPLDMETALQANAWTWGLENFQYKPEVRT